MYKNEDFEKIDLEPFHPKSEKCIFRTLHAYAYQRFIK